MDPAPPPPTPGPKAPSEPPTIDESDVQAFVESDRYCPSCGFNLLTRPVFREPRTKLLLLRCAECGDLHPANLPTQFRSVWAQRVIVPILFLWLGAIALVAFLVGLFEIGMHAATLENLTEWSRQGRIVIDDPEDYGWIMTLVFAGSTMMPLIEISMLTVVAHHWKRWGYAAVAALLPIVPLTIAFQIWRDEAPNLLEWGTPYILAHFGAQIVGGLVGAVFGRSIVRLSASLLLPPRVRTMLAFLWLADGLTPPAAAPKRG